MNSILADELSKPEYAGMTAAEAFAALPQKTEKVGRIQGDDKLDLVTVLAVGACELRWQTALAQAQAAEVPNLDLIGLISALMSTLKPEVILSDIFRVNLAVEEVSSMFEAANAEGLINNEEMAKIRALATYEEDKFGGFTEQDVAAALAAGETEATSVLYEGTATPHLVTAGKKLLKFKVMLDEPAAYDCTVMVKASGKKLEEEEYLPLARPFPITIKAGQLGVFSIDQAAAYFPRRVQFTATVDKANTPFTLDVVTS